MACARDRTEYIIAFDRVDRGLRTGSSIMLGGLEVGKVTDIGVGESYEILATIQIDKDVKIPADSKFSLDADMIGNTSIVIEPGTSNERIIPGSTLKGTRHEAARDSVSVPFVDIIQNILGNRSTRQDSILIELRRLNDNLEKMMKNQ